MPLKSNVRAQKQMYELAAHVEGVEGCHDFESPRAGRARLRMSEAVVVPRSSENWLSFESSAPLRTHCCTLGPCRTRALGAATEASDPLHVNRSARNSGAFTEVLSRESELQCLGSAVLRFAQRRAAGYLGTGCYAARAATVRAVLHPAVWQVGSNALVAQCASATHPL